MKRFKIISFLAAAVAVVLGNGPAWTGPAVTDRDVVMNKIMAGALIVDVRTPEEFAAGHYKGAVNIPLAEIQSRLSEFGDKNKPVVVYCRSGNRSAKAKAILEANGFRDVTNGGGLRDMPVSK